jgi:hypothetical protein
MTADQIAEVSDIKCVIITELNLNVKRRKHSNDLGEGGPLNLLLEYLS